MKLHPWFFLALAVASSLPAVACINNGAIFVGFERSRKPDQLPADVFKLHVHVPTEPLQIEVPILGKTVKRSVGKASTDPLGSYEDLIRSYEASPGEHQGYDERNDYAAALLFAGRFADAVRILVQLELDHPAGTRRPPIWVPRTNWWGIYRTH